jgi:hypothetical protein
VAGDDFRVVDSEAIEKNWVAVFLEHLAQKVHALWQARLPPGKKLIAPRVDFLVLHDKRER